MVPQDWHKILRRLTLPLSFFLLSLPRLRTPVAPYLRTHQRYLSCHTPSSNAPHKRTMHAQQFQTHFDSSFDGHPERPKKIETWFGFVKDPEDAQMLVNACVQGALKCAEDMPLAGNRTEPLRSGSVVVFCENSESMRVRWRDGLNWSCSKISGRFLLYREVVIGDTPVPQQRERHSNFIVQNVRKDTKLIPNGLAKRTISLVGDDGRRYRVINYFSPTDVSHFYKNKPGSSLRGAQSLQRPSDLPEFRPFRDGSQDSSTHSESEYQTHELIQYSVAAGPASHSLPSPQDPGLVAFIPSRPQAKFEQHVAAQYSQFQHQQHQYQQQTDARLMSLQMSLARLGNGGWNRQPTTLAPLRIPSTHASAF
ncbi:Gti1/Pac2 family-domain-containing protein [Chytriomyces sp. MP71]|nr:Gti1/Pac2 family-domain-containing protein [Chytriomyces sp. MP71]